jgi:hypothetical protein
MPCTDALHPLRPYGSFRRLPVPAPFEYVDGRRRDANPHQCCRSSVVEHPLGKGEVVSSILTGSTSKKPLFIGLLYCRRWMRVCCLMQNDAATCGNSGTFLTR